MELEPFVERCQNFLWDTTEGKTARDYLSHERGLSENLLRSLKVGYCGIAQESQVTWLPRPLRQKIVIPIYSEFEELVGLAARSSNAEIKGWWNTSFDKHHHLFLLHRARPAMLQNNKAYILEGYMDGMALHQEGLENACSLMGTVLGYRRIGLLKRYCNQVCLCFDSDINESGRRAQNRSIYELSRYKFDSISKIELPLKVDPDEFVLQHGLDEFLNLEVTLSKKEIKHHAEAYLSTKSS